MKVFTGKKNILWDFDGVIINSQAVREFGFREVLNNFPEENIKELLAYHRKNGGLSRYVKFRYFFEEIRREPVSESQIKKFSSEFSQIMRKKLIDNSVIISESLVFIRNHSKNFNMHIISGSDGEELRFLCDSLGLSKYFSSIEGSPVPKIELVKNLLKEYSYLPQECCLIGDSINDYEAAKANKIDFLGYNNLELENIGTGYIRSFS